MQEYINIPENKVIELYVNQKLSMHDTAMCLHCSDSTIQHRLDKLGIPRRSKSEGRSRYLKNHPEAMAKLLSKQVRFSKERFDNMSEQEKNQFIDYRTQRIVECKTPESYEKQSKSMTEYHANHPELAQIAGKAVRDFYIEHPEKKAENMKKLNDGLNASWQSPIGREKRMEIINSEEYKETFREAIEKSYQEHPERRDKMSKRSKKQWENIEYREKMSKVMLENWQKPEIRDKRITNTLKSLLVRPTSIEQIVIDIINEYKLPYKYVGNGEIIIEGKNPDFINTNGCKALLEVYGSYFHPPTDQYERIEYFRKFGFKTLILWDWEIYDRPHKEIGKKIRDFTQKCIDEFPLEIHLPM